MTSVETTSTLFLRNKHDNMMHFLASSFIKTGLGYTSVKLCPLILTMFDFTIFAGNGFAQKN